MKFLTPAFVTVAMLGVVGLLVVGYVAKNLLATEAPRPTDPLERVPMALTDLEPGTLVTEAHLAIGPALRSKLTREVAKTTKVVVGRVVKNPITAAQPIEVTDLYPPGQRPPIELAQGKRAVPISYGSDGGVFENMRKGQFVDVHFTPQLNYGNDRSRRTRGGMTMSLLKGIRVVDLTRNSRGAGVAMLELDPEQANVILLARERGQLHFTYSPVGGSGGIAVADENRAYLDEILGLPPEPEPTKPFVTEHFYGSTRTEFRFQDGKRIDWNDSPRPPAQDDLNDSYQPRYRSGDAGSLDAEEVAPDRGAAADARRNSHPSEAILPLA